MTKIEARDRTGRFAGLRVPLAPRSAPAIVTELDDGAAPLVVRAVAEDFDLVDWVAQHRSDILDQVFRWGRVLFRGFRVAGPSDFERVVTSIGGPPLPYLERSSPRTHLGGGVYTSTEYPDAFAIFPHNENSYQWSYPLFLGFHCAVPAQEGGETTLVDCRRVLERIDPAVRAKFAEKKVLFVRNFRPELGLPWQTAFQTHAPAEVEAHCREHRMTAEWRSHDHLRTSTVLSPLLHHPRTGHAIWFSHVAFFHPSTLPAEVASALAATYAPEDFPNATFYGDGSPIEPSVIAQIRAAYQREEAALAWRRNDVLLVDNARTAHGRRPFRGPRAVRVCMAHAVERDGN